MTAIATSVLELYDTHELSVDEIAQQLELEPIVVKSVLMQYSAKFRDEIDSNEDVEFVTKDEVKEFVAAYKEIARYSEEPIIREKTLRHLINMGLKVNDGLGASDPRKLLKELSGNGNIMNLNLIIQRAKEAKAQVLDNVLDIDLPKEISNG